MPKKSDAREQMILTAARLFRAHGYEGVGVAELLSESGAPRGSLYFHFPGGKKQIAAEAVALTGSIIGGRLAALRQRETAPDGYIQAAFDGWLRELKTSDFHNGCVVAVVALEMSERSPVLRAAADAVFKIWEGEFALAATDWGMNPKQAHAFASAMLGAIEGAIALARAKKSAEPFANGAAATKALANALLG